jgi:hypothetical protein
MVDDTATPLNPSIMPVEQEKFEETPFDVNVFQWLHKEESSRKMVCT